METDREGRVVRRADGERVRHAGRPADRRAPTTVRPFAPAAALAPHALAVTEEWRLPPHGVLTVNTAVLAGTARLTGSITVASDAPCGTLAGKAVAVDPATGASFDTLLRARPR